MRGVCISALLTAGLVTQVLARDVPANVRSLYNSIRGQGSCTDILKGGFSSAQTKKDTKDFAYCGDHLASEGIMYLQGTHGNLVNMDIDCDGTLSQGNGDCLSSDDTQGETAFQYNVQRYKKGITDLNAYIHSYVVLGNQGKKAGYVSFDPTQYGIQPLSIVAVVCGDQMFYAVWGDTNGDDGPPLVGEASLSLGQACYGRSVNGDMGHNANDVLYIAFKGPDAVPGANGANWNASSFVDFEASLATQGDVLVARILSQG